MEFNNKKIKGNGSISFIFLPEKAQIFLNFKLCFSPIPFSLKTFISL